MSATQRLLCYFKPNFSSLSPKNRLISNSIFTSSMPNRQGETGRKGSSWKEKPKLENPSLITNNEINTNRIANLSIAEQSGDSNVPSSSIQFGSAPVVNPVTGNVQKPVWKPKVTNVSGVATVSGLSSGVEANPVAENSSAGLSGMFKGPIGADFNVDKHTYALAKVRATFYPKFENEKSDQEVRSRMIELVHKGLATVEVSLKHSGSLFMYAGHEGGAYAKNSFGNVYTAVGVFVLGKMFREAWGSKAFQKQADFNDFLESNHMCIAMELVTAVLGDHGQRPQEDYGTNFAFYSPIL
ncbi:hypothetical protein GIB67_002124 [Kingdonia uniflora]|uniref:Uncharacterized protein n=1 Tax=Kingdonia uniflora TaxID=39325 RepID=A0A7J7KWI2_9MAGN|nr:hypothetical protein GIB67_002124 [Kingdonia uniflora]